MKQYQLLWHLTISPTFSTHHSRGPRPPQPESPIAPASSNPVAQHFVSIPSHIIDCTNTPRHLPTTTLLGQQRTTSHVAHEHTQNTLEPIQPILIEHLFNKFNRQTEHLTFNLPILEPNSHILFDQYQHEHNRVQTSNAICTSSTLNVHVAEPHSWKPISLLRILAYIDWHPVLGCTHLNTLSHFIHLARQISILVASRAFDNWIRGLCGLSNAFDNLSKPKQATSIVVRCLFAHCSSRMRTIIVTTSFYSRKTSEVVYAYWHTCEMFTTFWWEWRKKRVSNLLRLNWVE